MAAAVKGKGWVLEYGDSGGTPSTAIVVRLMGSEMPG